jgi:hypothetical protein
MRTSTAAALQGVLLAAAVLVSGAGSRGASGPGSEAVPDSSLVWHLEVRGDSAFVTYNRFADHSHGPFPRRVVAVERDSLRAVRTGGDEMSVLGSRSCYLVAVGEDGYLAGGARAAALGPAIAPNRLARAGSGSGFAILGVPPDEAGDGAVAGVRYEPVSLPRSDDYAWREAPPGNIAIVRLPDSTVFFAPGRDSILSTYEHEAREFGFSADGSLAVIVGPAGGHVTGKRVVNGKLEEVTAVSGHWLVLFDGQGRLLHEGDPIDAELNQLYVFPDGRTVYFDRRDKGGTRLVALDVAREKYHDLGDVVPAGYCFHSADGRSMVVRTAGGSSLFDCSDPLSPKLVASHNADFGPPFDCAVSADGSRVAIVRRGPWRPPLQDVVVFDRTMKDPRRVLEATRESGLEFVGRYLFVGRPELEANRPLSWGTTQDIYVFDLR